MQKSVEITNRGLTLRGMLHIPDNFTGKIPAVPIFHGFTGNKMEPHFIFVKLSRFLEKRGIASVRFDFGGSGESDGEFENMTVSGELDDAKAILRFVRSLDFIDPAKIGAVGLSLGGLIASLLAGDCPQDIRALCLWTPAAGIKDGIYKKMTEPEIGEFHKKGFWDAGGLPLGIEFMNDIGSMDVYGRAASYRGPVLLLHGAEDQIVDPEVSRKYQKLYGRRARLHFIRNADHTFNKLEWEKEVLERTLNFLVKELT